MNLTWNGTYQFDTVPPDYCSPKYVSFYFHVFKIRYTTFLSETINKMIDLMLIFRGAWLTHFSAVSHFYTPWKSQKTKGSIYIFKVNNRKTREGMQYVQKIKIKTPERRHPTKFKFLSLKVKSPVKYLKSSDACFKLNTSPILLLKRISENLVRKKHCIHIGI